MVKEIVAGVLLVILVVLAVLNVNYAERVTDELAEQIERTTSAEDAELALERWNEVKWYTHVMLRHSEIDFISDDYYTLIEAFRAGEDAETAKQRLIWRLGCIRDMERLSIGSIF